MTASELLAKMQLAGFAVRANGNDLEVTQARWIDDELADLIRQHKPALLTILKEKAHE